MDLDGNITDDSTIVISNPDINYVPETVDVVDINLVRVGVNNDYCNETTINWSWVRDGTATPITGLVIIPSVVSGDGVNDYIKSFSIPFSTSLDTLSGTLTILENGIVQDTRQLTATIVALS